MSALVDHLPDVLLALSAMTLALASPGPNVLAVIGTSMGVGRASGTALALGVAAGTLVWATAATLGLTALLATWAGAMSAIRLAGGGYLIWLGVRALRSAARSDSPGTSMEAVALPASVYFRQGLAVQLTNPKAALAMTAIATLGLGGGAPIAVGAVLVAGLTLLSAAAHCAYALAFSTPVVASAYVRCRRPIEALLGAFFCGVGTKLLVDVD